MAKRRVFSQQPRVLAQKDFDIFVSVASPEYS